MGVFSCPVVSALGSPHIVGDLPDPGIELTSPALQAYTHIAAKRLKKDKKKAEIAAIGVNSKRRRWNKLKKETENLS